MEQTSIRLVGLASWLLALGCGGEGDAAPRNADPTAPGGNAPAGPSQPAPTGTGVTPTPSATDTPQPGAMPTETPPAGYEYDPSITFQWPEAAPQRGDCLPGAYEGTFVCELAFIPGLPGFPFSGPVRFTLVEGSSGEFLEISDGLLEGDAGGILFSSPLAGQLDCSTNVFSAEATAGTYAGPGVPPGTFTGTLDATLDRLAQVLNGTWALSATGQAPCFGQWSATRVP